MTTLIIRDLSITAELDRTALTAVRGGIAMAPASYNQYKSSFQPESYSPSTFTFDVTQSLSQQQNTLNNNGNNVAWADNITSTVNPTQTGSNNISFL